MNKIIIIDGYSMLFRAYFATYQEGKEKLMRSKDGTPTNAIYAFSNMLSSILRTLKPNDAIMVALDSSKTTFRHIEYKEYKANRKPLDEELKLQFPIFRELLNSLNIFNYENPNLEADDIAGNIAKKMEKENYKVEIYTSDKDYLQLVDDTITVNLIKKGLKNIVPMTPETFKAEWGFDPIQIIDYKALRGDDSDNLKGIEGIGDITAKKLICEFHDFENIVKNANLSTKVGKNLVNCQDNGRLCLRLATIKTDDDLPITKEDLIYKGYDFNVVNSFAQKYGFKNLLTKLPSNFKQENLNSFKIEFERITSVQDLNIKDYISIAIDYDPNLNYHDAKLTGLGITLDNKNYYISYEDLLKDKALLEILKNKNIKKYCFDYKKIYCVLKNSNLEIDGLYFDLLLANYLLSTSNSYSIKDILTNSFIDCDYDFDDNSLIFFENPKLTCLTSYFSYFLSDKFIENLKKNEQYSLLIDIEQPLTIVLAEMEVEGFPLNSSTLYDFKQEYETKVETLKKEIYEIAGEQFNINSPKQLAIVLYDKLNLPTNRNRGTGFEHLNKITNESPIIDKILEYRKYSKLISTYIDGFIPFIDNSGKIHATFNQALTSTGRLSSSDPNLQNISIRDEEGKNIRKAFYYKENNLNILSLDYSQIELRILAHLSKSKTLINAFNSGEDIHSITAKKVFHLDREPTEIERRHAKAVNFGIVYGISDWGLAEQLKISNHEAREIIKSFYTEFPEIKEYLNNLVISATNTGYSLTMFNRRRYLTKISSSDYQEREFEKRAAMNAPIQGSAADLIKIAMIKVNKELKENNLNAKIVNQIHDEIILKVNDNEKDKVFDLVKNVMENCVKLDVKLKVDGGYAKSWYYAK